MKTLKQERRVAHGAVQTRISQNSDDQLRHFMTKLSLVVVVGIYLHLSVAVYRDMIVPMYSYYNFRWAGYSFENQAIATLLIVPIVLSLPLASRKFGDLVKWVLLFAVFVPSLFVPIASGYISSESGLRFNVMITAAFFSLHIAHIVATRGSTIRLPKIPFRTYVGLLVAAWVVIFTVFVLVAGFSLTPASLANAYDARAEFSANVSSQNIFLAYAIPFAGKVINPLLMVLGFWRRMPILVVMGILGSLLIFSANAQKSVFLTIALVPIAFLYLRNRDRIRSVALALAFVVLALVSLVSTPIMEFIFRRVIVTPGLLVGMYVDNYERNGFVYLRHSIFEGWSTNSSPAPADTIGLTYWGDPGMAANANFLGDGFANFGVVGMLGFAAILGLALGLVDRVTRDTSLSITAAASIGVIFALLDTALLTTFVTHGLIAMTLLLGMLPHLPRKGGPSFSRLEPASSNVREAVPVPAMGPQR